MTRTVFLTAALTLLGLAANLSAQTLQGHWDLDDAGGTTAADSSGNGHSATLLGGPVWAQGQIDGAVDFDGMNDRLSISSSPFGFQSWNSLTLSAWIKHDLGAENRTNDIVGQWNYPSSPNFILTHHKNNQYFFEIASIGFVTGGAVSTDWTLVVATYDGSQMNLYVNGTNVATATGLSGSLGSSPADVLIGSQADGSNYFAGMIDDVRIYEGALSATQVQALFDSAFDTTPPTPPQNLTSPSSGPTSISLSWDASSDSESGVSHYNVYRGGVFIGQASATNYTDGGLTPSTLYTYTVEAINGQGLISNPAGPLGVSTTADTVAPTIISASGSEFEVEIMFNETVDFTTAEDAGNYSIPTITVNSASLAGDNRTVTLATSAHTEGQSYDVTATGIFDLFGNATAGEVASYTPTFSDPALRGHWKLDDASGTTALDSSDDTNDGALTSGPTWSDGLNGGALRFDGIDDAVTVDTTALNMGSWGQITAMAWVRNDVGAANSTNDIVSYWNYPGGASWVMTHHRNNQYFFEIGGKSWVSGGTVSTDWTHVTSTYDGSTIRLYVNGVEVDSIGGLSGSLPSSAASLVIGSQDDDSNYFDGLIDDVRIYDRALNATEILEIYNDTSGVIASGTPSGGSSPLTVSFTAEDPGSDIVAYAWNFGEGGTSTVQNPQYTYVASGTYVATVVATHVGGETSSDTVTTVVSDSAPTIDCWYGPNQSFGNNGLSQLYVNILGNASSTVGISSLTFSLNGSADTLLSIGPDNRRLSNTGDFNIDIHLSDLLTGANQVSVTAVDMNGIAVTEVIDFTYDPTNLWALPYAVTWTDTTVLQEVVQVVDGKWDATSSGLRILEAGYDRVISVGDVLWTEYDVTVPITIHDYTPGYLGPESVSAGLGLTFRWTGHTNSPVACPQPRCGWLPSGAGAWYDIGSGGPLILDGNDTNSVTIDIGETHIWRFRVETLPGFGPLYSLKVWEQGTSEPSEWTLQSLQSFSDQANGSIVVNLHHVDATIGDITITEINGADLDPPTVSNVTATSPTTVTVEFSEDVDQATAETAANYFIDLGIVVFGAVLESTERHVTLTTGAFSEGVTYTIEIDNVTDLAGNTMVAASIPLTYNDLVPVANYPLDSASGVTANDSSGNEHHGTLSGGASWATDPTRGTVVRLDGFDDSIAIPSGPLAMSSWGQLSIAAWIQNDIGANAGTNDIVTWWEWTGWPCTNCSFVLSHHNNNQYRFELGGTFVLGGSVSTGWSHVVATYDGVDLTLYVDGLEIDSTPYSAGIPFSTADLIIGSQADASNYFDGSVDDVIIYDVSLTPQQVLDLYNQ